MKPPQPFWILSYSEFIDQKKAAIVSIDSPFEFGQGEFVTESIPVLQGEIHSFNKGEIGDFINGGLDYLIVHKRIKKIFDSLEVQNMQYFDLVFQDELGNTYNDYLVSNITELNDVTEKSQSEIVWDSFDGIEHLYYWKVSEQKVQEQKVKIFRPEEHFIRILVDQEIKDRFDQQEVSGIEFTNASDYTFMPLDKYRHLIFKDE